MEIIGFALLIGVAMELSQRRTLHAPHPCLWCWRDVVWAGDEWIHSDGQKYHRLGSSSAVHPALPDRNQGPLH